MVDIVTKARLEKEIRKAVPGMGIVTSSAICKAVIDTLETMPKELWVKNVGSVDDPCWVPCAKNDDGARDVVIL